MVNSWQQKVQEDLERYKRVGQENMSATGRQDMSATRRQNLAATQGKEVTFPVAKSQHRSGSRVQQVMQRRMAGRWLKSMIEASVFLADACKLLKAWTGVED